MTGIKALKIWFQAILLVIAFGAAFSVPDIAEKPPFVWIATVAIGCVALGIVLGLGMRDLLFSELVHREDEEL